MGNNTCSYYGCKEKAIGYFIGHNFGLWLCEKHKMGDLKQE